jgi:hypothetical protein
MAASGAAASGYGCTAGRPTIWFDKYWRIEILVDCRDAAVGSTSKKAQQRGARANLHD